MSQKRCAMLGATIALFLTLSLSAEENSPSFTDPKKAGIDFKIQGEYEGTASNGRKWGAHVLAQGGSKFKVIGYRGGLPGHGWEGDPGQYYDGALQNGVATFRADEFELRVDGELLKVVGRNGNLLAELKKQQRKSNTLGQAPPQDAIVLFDGSSASEWEHAKLVEGKYLGATNCFSKRKFGDHRLHLEFRVPFVPEASGQARGNSGVYIQSRYEVQVLDSFGLEGKADECGGIYKISRPKLNMCYPPLSWQTYDIDFTAAKYHASGEKTANARITVRHNDVVIHDALELPQHTPGRFKEGPGPEALFLQNHENPVVYRNIWVIEK